MKKYTNLLWGFVLVALGIIIGLNSFGVTDIDLFFDGWWTLFIIVPCFIELFSSRDKTGAIIGLVIGVLLLLACQEILTFELILKLAVPVILVLIGACLIFKDAFTPGKQKAFKSMQQNASNLASHSGIFSSQNFRYDGVDFAGAELTAVFGGVICATENSFINGDCLVNCTSIFGGIDLYVPTTVNVVVRSTSIFGGVEDKRMNQNPVAGPTVYVNALCLFGGVDIK